MPTVNLTVNGKSVAADVEERTLLVYFLREQLQLTGTHIGCDTSQCGACVVHVDGHAVKSCSAVRGAGSTAAMSSPSKAWPRTASFIRCRKRFATITACNAASARRA